MSQYKGIIRSVFSGAISAGDIWSVGLNLRIGTLPIPAMTSAELTTFAGTLAGQWITDVWNASPGILGQIAPDTAFDTCRTYGYDIAGNLIAQGANVRTPVVGTAASIKHPGYTACCVTLQTQEFGRSFRGRMYLPVTGTAMATGLQFSSTNVVSFATQVAAFLGHVLGMTPVLGGAATPVAPIVYSSKLGFESLITSVKVDSIPDTQHGRTNRLTAANTSTHTVP